MIAELQARSGGMQRATVAPYTAHMSGKPDMTPAVREVREAQARRLTRLRLLLEMTIRDSAERAGASEDQWSRMERAAANIDAVKLARWCLSVKLPGDYVLTGSLHGMPDHISRALIEDELRSQLVASGRTQPAPLRVSRGRKRQKHTGHSGGGETQDGSRSAPVCDPAE